MYIGKIAGLKIKISFLFLILIVTMGFFGMLIDGILMFLVVIVHELGHVIVAKKKYYGVESIEILPIGGVATINQSHYNQSSDEWYIALAGPMNNIFFIIVLVYLKDLIPYHDKLINYNMSLFFFNLLPAFPLDGGRLLKAHLTKEKSVYQSSRIVASLGILIGLVFVFLGIYYIKIEQTGFIYLGILGLFLTIAAYNEFKSTKYLPIKYSITKEVNTTNIRDGSLLICDNTALVKDIMKEIQTNKELIICVVDEAGEIIDMITEKTVIQAYQKGNGSKSIIEIFNTI
ncbi:M50 family metallopeptidase [Alkalicella caledoniensis]|uniref:M50 family metallopeptidase n=1 Tax=Alkalicella caledoniensis TaxID=2731377 RepID=A0A7G9W4I9_ALKCA|nr:M50 family metallopeptidase [Alkalicella caledoniensis]QNO13601.1 M50 family metallopeptidase [Alkalicella caledoniensis]